MEIPQLCKELLGTGQVCLQFSINPIWNVVEYNYALGRIGLFIIFSEHYNKAFCRLIVPVNHI